MKNVTVSHLFTDGPGQYGLRGDINLWQAFEEETLTISWPNNVEELETILYKLYEELTGSTIKNKENFYVEKFATGGMSSGFICPEFWFKKGFPLIIERFKEYSK